jgi:hypothetical protein
MALSDYKVGERKMLQECDVELDLHGYHHDEICGERPDADPERTCTAYHEAGHAVLHAATGYPCAMARVNDSGDSGTAFFYRKPYPVGLIEKPKKRRHTYKVIVGIKKGGGHIYGEPRTQLRTIGHEPVADWSKLDAFGNPATDYKERRETETEAEHWSMLLGAMGGPLAELKHRGEPGESWTKQASASDKSNAGSARASLKKLGRPVEQAEQQARELVEKHWHLIEAVAKALVKRGNLSATEIDSICRSAARRHIIEAAAVVRRQHIKGKQRAA